MDLSRAIEDIMTLAEAAEYLKLSEKTVLKMAQRGEIPAAKIASQWRFRRQVLEDWLTSRMKVIPETDMARVVESGTDLLPISRLISEDYVVMDIRAGSKEEVLSQLIAPLVRNDVISDKEAFLKKLMQREQMASTALGQGVAIPHIRQPQENPAGLPDLVVGICREGTDFEAGDRHRTHLLFLLCTDSEVVHVRIMAKLANILRQPSFVSRLIEARNKDEVVGILIEADQKMLMI